MPVWAETYLSATNPYFYPAVFFLLFAAGLGVPVSADLVLLTVGYIAYHGQAEYQVLIPVAIAGILSTDATMFMIARHYGRKVLSYWPFRKIFTADRLKTAEENYHHYGYRMIFLARFMPGIRTVFVFTGGLLRLNLPKFMLYDFLGAIIVVPGMIYSVKWVAGNFDGIRTRLEKMQWYLLGGMILVVLAALLWKKSRTRRLG